MQSTQRCGKFFRIIFTLLHGQTVVESRFLVNSKLLVENLQEKTLVASCFVYSSVKSDADNFSGAFFYPQTERKCSGSKNAISVIFRRAKKTSC